MYTMPTFSIDEKKISRYNEKNIMKKRRYLYTKEREHIMNERLKRLRKTLHLTQQQFADRLNVGRNNIAGYETGKRSPSDAAIALICREFNVNTHWLREGIGEMFIQQTPDEQIASFVGNIQMGEADSFKKQLLSVLADLTEEQWKLLAEIAGKLADKNQG